MSYHFFKSSSLLAAVDNDDTSTPSSSTNIGNKRSLKKGSGLSLNEDVLHLICEELVHISPSSLLALARVCRSLNDIATPYIYRNIILSTGEPWTRKKLAVKALIQRLSGEAGNILAKHVRHLQVEKRVSETDLEQILDKINNLQEFSWNTVDNMPKSILQKLQTKWPSLKISVRNNGSREDRRRLLDPYLLSSPNLDTLNYTIFTRYYDYQTTGESEWPGITQALVSGAHCKRLRIEMRPLTHPRSVMLHPSEPQFAIAPGMKLPPLEELAITRVSYAPEYRWDISHCRLLRTCMDWTRMKKLDLSAGYPEEFLAEFAGYVPNLKHLRFDLPGPHTQSYGLTPAVQYHIAPAASFLDSLTELETLDVQNLVYHYDALWPAIRRHKITLQELILRPSLAGYCITSFLPLDCLKEVSTEFIRLERLGFDVPFKGSKLDEKFMSCIARMNLKSLDLFIHLPYGESAYSAELTQDVYGSIPAPEIDVPGAKAAAIAIADEITASQKRPLQILTLHITRTGVEDRAQTYLMQAKMQLRRSDRDDAQTLGDEKYRIHGNYQWRGQDGWGIEDLLKYEQ